MSLGIETFSVGWKNNQAYITTLSDSVVDDAGFATILVGSLNTASNSYTPITSFTSLGQKLTGVVTSPLGVSITPITITVTYHNQSGLPRTISYSYPPGSSVGTAKTFYMLSGDGMASITIASASPRTSGTIQFFGTLNLTEVFDSTKWGPPDPGL